jgi:2-polyprenyl-3-methyl-5-hydroxy-6-metoxy-1,4-benzoquinol methylase
MAVQAKKDWTLAVMDVTFAADPKANPEFPCRVCRSWGATPVLSVDGQLGLHRLFRCGACHSLYFDGTDPVIGYQDFVSEAFWLDYVQAGAGITTMLAPLNAMDPLPEGDLIDVGCGFGFVVEYWSNDHNRAIGLESSYYGEVGREKLGVDIRPQLLDEYRATDPDRQFSIVYSSEVIEHTSDPERFLDDLVLMLASRSILVLTTPSVTIIRPETDRAKLIAALSPGFHYAILSEKIMRQMLEKRGLHFHIATHDGQMIVWASRAELPGIEYGRTNWPRYFAQLERLSQRPDPHVAMGALVRMVKDGLNTNHRGIAEDAWDRLLPLARQVYGIDLMQPDIAELIEIRAPLAALDRFPSWLGNALLFGGLLVGHRHNDRRGKLRMLGAALTVMRRRADVDLQFGQEAQSFLPFAERQYVIALSEALTTSLLPREAVSESDLRSSLNVLQGVIGKVLGAGATEVQGGDR